MMMPVACPSARHEDTKKSIVWFLWFNRFVGVQDPDDGEHALVLANCRDCESTLAMPMREESER